MIHKTLLAYPIHSDSKSVYYTQAATYKKQLCLPSNNTITPHDDSVCVNTYACAGSVEPVCIRVW